MTFKKIEVEINDKQLEDIIRQDLIDSYFVARNTYGEFEPIVHSLKHVIEYYSTPAEYSEFLNMISIGE